MMGTASLSMTMIRAVAFFVSGGLALGKQRMFPMERRIMSISFTTSCTVSPAMATFNRLGSSISSDGACRCSSLETLTVSPTGKTTNWSPTSTNPWITRPRVTIPFPSAKTSVTINRRGFSICRLAGKKLLTASSSVGPLYHFESSLSSLQVFTFSPTKPETGTNRIRFGLNSCFIKKSLMDRWISSYRSFFHPSTSSLLMATTTWVTPRPRASMMCSLVWPPPVNPASNSPVTAAMTRMATSALAAPVIITGIKSWWPGASSTTMS
mmetsp:Transcript_15126/g.34648  ORF Transcript_15126/g.34648 Transcript_15126/m.34648 type:complete len:267 (+) Transcript_15126:1374-2174(+)